MGTEYRHFMVVDDATWLPQSDTAKRVEAVLRNWSLVEEGAKVTDLSSCSRSQAHASGDAMQSSPGPGVAIVYPGANGPAVATVAGPSAYPDISSEERYLKRATLVIGDDYRVQWSTDGVYFELLSPPLAGGVPVLADEQDIDDALFAESYPSENATSPPVVTAHIAENAKSSVAWDTCLGYWRGALVLDFGKDLPAFCEQIQALPACDFLAEISAALRGPLVEIGEFY